MKVLEKQKVGIHDAGKQDAEIRNEEIHDTAIQRHTLPVKRISEMEKVFPCREPSGEGATRRPSGLKGETISFQIAYYGDVERKQYGMVRAEAPDGVRIRVRRVGLVPCAYPCHRETDPGYLVTEPGMYPDILEEIGEAGFPIVSGQWQSLWVDVETSGDTPAGEYPVAVILESQAFAPGMKPLYARVETAVEVIDAELPDLELFHTEWLHCDCLAQYYGVEVFSERHWELIEHFVRHAAKRGCNMLLTPVFTPPLDTAVNGERLTVQLVDVTVTDEGYAFGYDRFRRWVEMCGRCGIRYLEISHLFSQWGAKAAPKIMSRVDSEEHDRDHMEHDSVYPKIMSRAGGEERRLFGWETRADSEEYRAFLQAFLSSFTEELERLGIRDRCFFHVSDEPEEKDLESYAYAKNLVRQYLPGNRVIDALSDHRFYEQGLVDEPVCANDHIEPFLKDRPPRLWTYYCTGQHLEVSNRFISLPGFRTRILGVQLYKYAIDGFLHWGYNFYNSDFSRYPIDPYRSTDADGAFPSGDPFLVYPGKDGKPVDSIRSMLMEKAMADLRAMRCLEKLTDRETVLQCLMEKENGEITFRSYPQNMEYLEEVRERIHEAIRKHC